MATLQKAVGRGQPNLPADVRLVQGWVNWWVVALNHMPFPRLEDAISWFQGEVTGDPSPSGIVEPRSVTENNLQQRPSVAAATLPTRPPIGGPLPTVVDAGTPLKLPPRTGMQPLTDADYAAAAKTFGCEALAI